VAVASHDRVDPSRHRTHARHQDQASDQAAPGGARAAHGSRQGVGTGGHDGPTFDILHGGPALLGGQTDRAQGCLTPRHLRRQARELPTNRLERGATESTLGVIVALCIAWWSTSPAALVTAALLMITSLGSRTEAIFDGRFLRARIGIIGPWRTIPVAGITDAEVVHVSPAAWFCYGLRWRGREQAFVVRTGPGLRVQLRNRLSLVMSLDDPATGVQLIRRSMDTGRPHPGVP